VACNKCILTWAAVGGVGVLVIRHHHITDGWTLGTPTPDVMGITALTIGDAWAAFSAQNPSLFTMKAFGRKGGEEGELSKRDLRMGALIGTGMALVVAAGASMVTNSWWPVVGTTAACGVQWAVLEHALANPWGKGGGIAHQPSGGTGG
jgi:hypothetical protein